MILVDIDGVVANFAQMFLDYANNLTNKNFVLDDIKEWKIENLYPVEFREQLDRYLHEPGVCSSISVLPHAEKGLKMLREKGPVLAVTSPMDSKFWHAERVEWLQKLGFSFKDILFVSGSRKHLVQGTLLIEDSLETLLEWKKHNPNGTGLLMDRPYNQVTPAARAIWGSTLPPDCFRVSWSAEPSLIFKGKGGAIIQFR